MLAEVKLVARLLLDALRGELPELRVFYPQLVTSTFVDRWTDDGRMVQSSGLSGERGRIATPGRGVVGSFDGVSVRSTGEVALHQVHLDARYRLDAVELALDLADTVLESDGRGHRFTRARVVGATIVKGGGGAWR